jgi:hypothetical protein
VSEFHEAITATLWVGGAIDTEEVSDFAAGLVLNMPEMRAIRKALHGTVSDFAEYGMSLRQGLASYGLPEEVVAWVLDGES